MRVNKIYSLISSLLVFSFFAGPLSVFAQSNLLQNFNTTDLTKSDLFVKDFLGGGYAMLDCFGASSNILDTISGFGIDEIQGGVFDAVTVNDRTQNLKTECLDVAAQINAQKTVASMSKSIFTWSETGNGGDPLYVQDFGKYLKSIDKQEVGILKNEFTKEILNDPQKLPFAKDTVKVLQKSEKYKNSTISNLSYSGPNKEEFSKSFKTGGGWSSWLKMTQNPKNNPIGFNLKVSEELQKKQEEAKENVKEELKQTNFLPVKKCIDPNYKNDGTPISDEDKKAGKTDICNDWEVQTPGSIVKDQVSQAITSPLRLAENVDEKGKQLNVMFASLLTQLFNQGFSTLGNRANGVVGNVEIRNKLATYGENTRSENSPETGDWFDSAWIGGISPKDIPTIISNQKQIIEKLPERAYSLQQIIDSAEELDYCVPGPNPNWYQDLGDFISIKMEEYGKPIPAGLGKKMADGAASYGGITGAVIGGIVGSIIPGAGTLLGAAIGSAIGSAIGTMISALSGPSQSEINRDIYAKNTILDTTAYLQYITTYYDNVGNYGKITFVDNKPLEALIDNSRGTLDKLQTLLEIKTNSIRQYINIPLYKKQIEKNTQYVGLMKKQLSRMQDICVQTHKLYVKAFNRQSRERIAWESWSKNPEREQLTGYRNKQTGKIITPTQAEKMFTVYRSPYNYYKDVIQENVVNQNSESYIDTASLLAAYTPVMSRIPEPKKVPPLPSFSDYALNCTGNIGSGTNGSGVFSSPTENFDRVMNEVKGGFNPDTQ